jgi:hypothetical protein
VRRGDDTMPDEDTIVTNRRTVTMPCAWGGDYAVCVGW